LLGAFFCAVEALIARNGAPAGLEPATSLLLLSDVRRISVSRFAVDQRVLYPLELRRYSNASDSVRGHEQNQTYCTNNVRCKMWAALIAVTGVAFADPFM
jgi:hypothetical protein